MNVRTLSLAALVACCAAGGVVLLRRDAAAPSLPSSLVGPAAAARTVHGAAGDAGPVRAVGVMIHAPTGSGAAARDPYAERAFLGTFEATRLALELVRPEGGMLGLDAEACRLERFADDRGTDLRKRDAAFGPFEMLPRVSDDGERLVFVVPSDRLPEPTASRLIARGTAAVRVATRSETHTGPAVPLLPGTRVSLAGYELEIEAVGAATWGEGRSLVLSAGRDTQAIARYALVDEAGAEIPLEPSIAMSGMGVWRQTLEAPELPERAALRIEAWSDLRTVAVPFEVEAGLGLR